MIVTLWGCSNKPDVIITDYKTESIIAEFYMDNDTNNVISITDMLTDLSDETIEVKEEPNYEVHLIDSKDSANDIWFLVYEIDNAIYVQVETDKMSDKFALFYDDSIKESVNMTVNEFSEIIAKNK